MDTKKLRQKILDLAIHGKLVPQDPNDEPASVLLERIRAEKERLIAEGKIKRSKKSATSDTSHYENVPFEVPDGWSWVKMEDYVFGVTDGDHQPPPQAKKGVPFLVISDVNTGNIKFEKSRFVEESYFCSLPDNRKASKGDLLFTVTGSYGIVIPVETERDFCFQRHIGLIKVIVDSSWLKYVLMSKYVQSYCDEVATGTAQKTVGLATLRDLLIPIPPLSEQQRIISVIEQYMSSVDDVKTSTSILKDCIEKVKSKILDLAIHGKLVSQDTNDEPASELLKRINPKAVASCDNPHYENVPSNWVCTTMGSIFQHNTGKALNKSVSVEGTLQPYLTTSNVYWNTFDLSVVKEMRFKESEIKKCTVRKGDLLVCEGGDIGRSAIWNKDYSICIQNHLHRLRPKGDIVPLLYLYFIMYLKLTNNLEGKGIGLQGFSSGLLDKLEVPLPPYNEQIRIVKKIQEAFNTLDFIAESLI